LSVSDGEYRTKVLSEAVFLAGLGHTYEIVRLSSHECAWVFNPPEAKQEEFDEQLANYDNHQALVEPASYTLELTRMRKELYAFLDRPAHRRRAVSPSADGAPA
jgi:hypothetical protein